MKKERKNMELSNFVICGGTFDHFHKGHKDFLRAVFKNAKKAVIGITSDLFVENSKEIGIQTYKERKRSVENFLKAEERVRDEIVSIDNPFGPTLEKKYSHATLVVSQSTEKGAELINSERKMKGFSTLPVIVIPLTKAEDGLPISSTRIRNGEIDRGGKLTVHPSWFFSDRYLPKALRAELSRPKGQVVSAFDQWLGTHDPTQVVTVGDVVTEAFNNKKFKQILSIIDFHVARKKKHNAIKDLGFSFSINAVSIVNPAGTLTGAIFQEINSFFSEKKRSRSVFVIQGEEDLVVLPLLLRSPLGFSLIYGQPGEGIIDVSVTEENKKMAYNLVSQFTLKQL